MPKAAAQITTTQRERLIDASPNVIRLAEFRTVPEWRREATEDAQRQTRELHILMNELAASLGIARRIPV